MKIWTMPRVSIEAFTPNEYVANCMVTIPNDYQYLDIAHSSGIFGLDYSFGDGDGKHQSVEDITSRSGDGITLNGRPSIGWFENVFFYKSYSFGLINQTYNNGSAETYDVYFYRNDGKAYVFTRGSAQKGIERAANHS